MRPECDLNSGIYAAAEGLDMPTSKRIRVLCVEEFRLFRDASVLLLNNAPDIKAACSDASVDGVLKAVRRFRPHVIVLGIGVSEPKTKLVHTIHTEFPKIKVIIVESVPGNPNILEFLREKVSDFIDKDGTLEDIVSSIRMVATGKRTLPQMLSESFLSGIVDTSASNDSSTNTLKFSSLSERQKDVVRLIDKGYSNKQIADELCLSVHTVKSHIHSILERLQLQSRLEIASLSHMPESIEESR